MSNIDYTESPEAAAAYRARYEEGLRAYTASCETQAEDIRKSRAAAIFRDPEKSRKELCQMLGAPLGGRFPEAKLLEKTYVADIDGCAVYRTVMEAIPGLPFYGLLFEQKDGGRYPLVISQHGGLGTPELCSTMYETGSSNYNDMTRRLLKYKVNIYAPQLYLWRDADENGINRMDERRHALDTSLKACGSSITAVELYCIGCALSTLSAYENMDSTRIGMAGLSYGGLYTMLMAAVDTRIKAAVSSSFFGGIVSTHHSDWNWQSCALQFEDAELAALTWPRDITYLMGDQDPLFDYKFSQQQFDELKAVSGGLPIEAHIRFKTFEGPHEFCKDDAYIAHMMDVLGARKA